jgi:hypothetical protein
VRTITEQRQFIEEKGGWRGGVLGLVGRVRKGAGLAGIFIKGHEVCLRFQSRGARGLSGDRPPEA